MGSNTFWALLIGIGGMGWAIASAIDKLQKSVDALGDQIHRNQQATEQRINDLWCEVNSLKHR